MVIFNAPPIKEIIASEHISAGKSGWFPVSFALKITNMD
jgi:hypothetical protein